MRRGKSLTFPIHGIFLAMIGRPTRNKILHEHESIRRETDVERRTQRKSCAHTLMVEQWVCVFPWCLDPNSGISTAQQMTNKSFHKFPLFLNLCITFLSLLAGRRGIFLEGTSRKVANASQERFSE